MIIYGLPSLKAANDNWTHWLDRIVAEQAAYYGLSVPDFQRMSRYLAIICDSADNLGIS